MQYPLSLSDQISSTQNVQGEEKWTLASPKENLSSLIRENQNECTNYPTAM